MSFPNFTFWSHLLVTLGIEVCCVAALGFLAQLFFRRVVWQRTIWQMTVLCLVLLPASEWTGLGRGIAWFLVGPKQEPLNAPAPALVTANPMIFRQLAMPPYRVLARPKSAVWWPGWVWLIGADGFSIQTTAAASIKTGNQTREVAGSQKLWDGETLVMRRVMTNLPPNTRKVAMVLVSLRIIDPAGNAVHTDDEISNMRRKE